MSDWYQLENPHDNNDHILTAKLRRGDGTLFDIEDIA